MFIEVLAVFIIFIPTMIAFYRNLTRRWACLVVNALLGWTGIFWFPILIWSLLTSAVDRKPTS
ncbi:MAG: superinfection immunity protein [Nitrososphaerales archaeon]